MNGMSTTNLQAEFLSEQERMLYSSINRSRRIEKEPFLTSSPLKSLVSSALVPNNADDDILHFAEKGQKRFEDFINDRLLSTLTVSVIDLIKKPKLKTFSNLGDKIKVQTGDKVIKLCEERELFGRFLIIQGSRPELVLNLEDAVGEFEMSAVQQSLCAVEESLYISTEKASLMHVIEAAKSEPRIPDLPPDDIADGWPLEIGP